MDLELLAPERVPRVSIRSGRAGARVIPIELRREPWWPLLAMLAGPAAIVVILVLYPRLVQRVVVHLPLTDEELARARRRRRQLRVGLVLCIVVTVLSTAAAIAPISLHGLAWVGAPGALVASTGALGCSIGLWRRPGLPRGEPLAGQRLIRLHRPSPAFLAALEEVTRASR